MSTSDTTSKVGMRSRYLDRLQGSVPERPKGADCKSAGTAFGGSNPPRPTSTNPLDKPAGQAGRLVQTHPKGHPARGSVGTRRLGPGTPTADGQGEVTAGRLP